jgi:hypothetical protein
MSPMRNEELDAVTEQLRAAGIYHWTIASTGSGHLQVRWQTGGGTRSCVVAATGSDHKGQHNACALVRRMLKADGLLVDQAEPAAASVKLPAWRMEL